MGTDKPRISILMAVYEPRMDWLREQLLSLEEQTYPNLKLYIRDDCSPTVPFEAIQSCVRECIHAFPYELARNEVNLGSNKTFEQLTREAEGEYFAYCDQDDVWLPEKLTRLRELMARQNCSMTYSDMSVIDGKGAPLAASLRELRPRLRYVQGEDLWETYFFRNCTAGCSMLIRADIAKQAVPFPPGTVCDQWLAIVAAASGRIGFLDMCLTRYRQHGGNQTGILHGVEDKESYRARRLLPLEERLKRLEEHGVADGPVREFVLARLSGNIWKIWKYRKFSRWEAAFEIMMRLTPDRFVKRCLRRIR